MATANLRSQNICVQIICKDVFNTSLKKQFDIVYSMELIEHFLNPEKIIDEHIELLKSKPS